jgi:hypothetical protein
MPENAGTFLRADLPKRIGSRDRNRQVRVVDVSAPLSPEKAMRTVVGSHLLMPVIFAAILIGGASHPSTAQDAGPAAACAKGTDESNATLATAYMNAFASANDMVFDDILATDYKHHFGIGDDAQTPAGLKQKVGEWKKAFDGCGALEAHRNADRRVRWHRSIQGRNHLYRHQYLPDEVRQDS